MEEPRSRPDEWLVAPDRPNRKPEAEAVNESRRERSGADREPGADALADLRRRIDALEAGGPIREMEQELRTEMHALIAEEINALADRLTAASPVASHAAQAEPAAAEPVGDPQRPIDKFLSTADAVEHQVRRAEERIAGLDKEIRRVTPPYDESTAAAGRGSATGSELGSIDINRISFEELRELGLSVTQAASVLAYRDARGRFESIDDLDEVPELPDQVLARLKRHFILA